MTIFSQFKAIFNQFQSKFYQRFVWTIDLFLMNLDAIVYLHNFRALFLWIFDQFWLFFVAFRLFLHQNQKVFTNFVHFQPVFYEPFQIFAPFLLPTLLDFTLDFDAKVSYLHNLQGFLKKSLMLMKWNVVMGLHQREVELYGRKSYSAMHIVWGERETHYLQNFADSLLAAFP